MVKIYVLDTNILLSSPKAMTEGFDDNIVVITGTTLQELDKKKTLGGDIGYNARESCRILDSLRKQGSMIEGVALRNGGILKIEPDGVDQKNLPQGYSIDVPDNRIISSCVHIQKQTPDLRVILVTNDISMRVNATVCGVDVEGYRNDQVEESGYTGHTIKQVDKSVIDKIYADKSASVPASTIGGRSKFFENQFVTLRDKTKQSSILTVYQGGNFKMIPKQTAFGGIQPKNAMQSYAMWALSAPAEQIPLVVMSGVAGTAKTFLSLACGLNQTYVSQRNDGAYSRIIISRPSAGGFSEMGFLPGDMKQKLDPLLSPYYDNMKILLSGSGKQKEDPEQVRLQIDEMFDRGIIEILALSFIRGRSLMDTYLICDEAQNASRGLIRDVITRAGKGTKVVVCGDPNQIDQPTLDKRNNGLVYAMETMKGSPLAAIIQFDAENSVRSDLAKEAVKRMK